MNSAIAGASVANGITFLVLAVANCIRKRLNKSKCESHCYIFDCEAQLDDLREVKNSVVTQRGLLQNVIELLDSKSSKSQDLDATLGDLRIQAHIPRGKAEGDD